MAERRGKPPGHALACKRRLIEAIARGAPQAEVAMLAWRPRYLLAPPVDGERVVVASHRRAHVGG